MDGLNIGRQDHAAAITNTTSPALLRPATNMGSTLAAELAGPMPFALCTWPAPCDCGCQMCISDDDVQIAWAAWDILTRLLAGCLRTQEQNRGEGCSR
jgi:hypothetical protein